MKTAGIITEYNPLHYGHLALIQAVRQQFGGDTAIICAMSGDFVQRGDFALVRRHARRRPPSGAGRIWYWSCPSPGPSVLPRDSPKAASRFSPPRGCWTCWLSAANAETAPLFCEPQGRWRAMPFSRLCKRTGPRGQLCRRPPAGCCRLAFPIGCRPAVRPQQHPWDRILPGAAACGRGSCAVYDPPDRCGP